MGLGTWGGGGEGDRDSKERVGEPMGDGAESVQSAEPVQVGWEPIC